MKTYRAMQVRIEHRVEYIECEANSLEEAETYFDSLIEDSTTIDFDSMECVHAEDWIQDIEEVK